MDGAEFLPRDFRTCISHRAMTFSFSFHSVVSFSKKSEASSSSAPPAFHQASERVHRAVFGFIQLEVDDYLSITLLLSWRP